MTIMRTVLESKYNNKLKKIISKLSDWDKIQLNLAESNDKIPELEPILNLYASAPPFKLHSTVLLADNVAIVV